MGMNKFATAVFLPLALMILCCLGCARTPMAAPHQDAAAKTFAAVPGKAVVYVYRSEVLGTALKFQVFADQQYLGETVTRSYLRFELEPGEHKIISRGSSKEAELALQAEPGKVYYIWQEMKMGMWLGGSKLHLMPEDKGQAGVGQCSLVGGADAPAR
jgi:hypothetical protein